MKELIRQILKESTSTNSNFDRVMDEYSKNSPETFKPYIETIRQITKSYIKNSGYNVKFLNACSAGFAGVRTDNEVIICKPNIPNTSFGDFIYTIFHEMRHETQVSKIKMPNPISEFDLEDFENLYEQYWEMELDADQFAKNMIAKLVIKSKIPIDIAKRIFLLSRNIENYPSLSGYVKNYIKQLVDEIKRMRASGKDFRDIKDHPMIARYIDKLEDFI